MIKYDKNSVLTEKVIFYVEDDVLANDSVTFLLKRCYKNVYSFTNPVEALDKIKENIHPDIVITDVQMPVMNGIDFLKELRNNNINIPKIVMTAFNDSEYLKEALDLKVDKYITKPIVNMDEVIDEVFNLLSLNDEKKLNNFLNNSSIYTKTDINGFILNVSDGFCELSGYSRQELIGNKHNILRYPNMPKNIYENLWNTIQSGKISKGELKNLRKDGATYWIEHTISPEFDDNGTIIGFISLSNDITEKKNFEEEHLRLLREAKNSSIEDLLENISHQWRQPLSVISLNAAQLELDLEFKNLSETDKRNSLESIMNNTQKLSSIIEKFSSYISNDKYLCNIFIEDEIEHAIDMFESSLITNKIKLIKEIDLENKTKISFVQNEITQVVLSLLSNSKEAFIATNKQDDKFIKITAKKENDSYKIILEDNAGGIDKSIIDKIFEAYFTTKFKAEGVGLGLHLTQRIINESFKGDISIKNSDQGAIVTIDFPITEV